MRRRGDTEGFDGRGCLILVIGLAAAVLGTLLALLP